MSKFYNTHFKEELVATAVLMAIVISGSFVVAYRSLQKNNPDNLVADKQVLGVSQSEDELNQLLHELSQTPTPRPPSTPTPTSTPKPQVQPISTQSATLLPSYNNTIIEQPYGAGGEYDNADYRLTILNPRLIVSTSRVFKVDVTLANKRIENGLKNRLSATIIKDGVVIAESVPFSLSESATAYPGEQITFAASMSLISGTDVSRLKYLPLIEGVADTLHDL